MNAILNIIGYHRSARLVPLSKISSNVEYRTRPATTSRISPNAVVTVKPVFGIACLADLLVIYSGRQFGS